MKTKIHTPKPDPAANQKTEGASDGASCSSSISETPETDALRDLYENYECRANVGDIWDLCESMERERDNAIIKLAKPGESLGIPCRYSVATDGIENTVYDHEGNCDLFPTKSGNRDYQCRKCNEDTAKEIALAMNIYDLTMRENHLYEIGNVELARRCRQQVFELCGFQTNVKRVHPYQRRRTSITELVV